MAEELLKVSEGNKTFAELVTEIGEEAAINLVLDKATKGAFSKIKKLKSAKWADEKFANIQEKGKEWLAKKGYSPEKIKLIERKFDDINDIAVGNKSLDTLVRERGKDYVDKVLMKDARKKGIQFAITDTKSGPIYHAYYVDPITHKSTPIISKNNAPILGSKNPHDSRKVREELEEHYGKENVSSHTIPPLNKPNVRLAGKEKVIQLDVEREVWDAEKNDLVTKIVKEDLRITFNKKGFPIFDDVNKVELRMPTDEFRKLNHDKQMVESTKKLALMIKNGEIPKSQFTKIQLDDIYAGKKTISGFIWHHHEDTGRMQLVPRDIHEKVRHIGWEALEKGAK
ncbi:unnamed protein product [Diamesa hyperborea]